MALLYGRHCFPKSNPSEPNILTSSPSTPASARPPHRFVRRHVVGLLASGTKTLVHVVVVSSSDADEVFMVEGSYDRQACAMCDTHNDVVARCGARRSFLVGTAAPASLARESPLPGLDELRVDVEDCGALRADNCSTSALGLGQEDALQPEDAELQDGDDGGSDLQVAEGGDDQASVTPLSSQDFIDLFRKPLEQPLIAETPRPWKIRRERRLEQGPNDSSLVPKRSARLAAKSNHRARLSEDRARMVMMKKMGVSVPTEAPDVASFDEFHAAFTLPLQADTRKAMQVLWHPGRKRSVKRTRAA